MKTPKGTELLNPRYWWRHGGATLASSGPRLSVESVARRQAGQYTVVASNAQGTANASFTVDVQCEWMWGSGIIVLLYDLIQVKIM